MKTPHYIQLKKEILNKKFFQNKKQIYQKANQLKKLKKLNSNFGPLKQDYIFLSKKGVKREGIE